MKFTRRQFVATGAGSVAGFWLGAGSAKGEDNASSSALPDEDGSKLWLRYAPQGKAGEQYRPLLQQLNVGGTSATAQVIRDEWRLATTGMFGAPISEIQGGAAANILAIGTPATLPAVSGVNWAQELRHLGEEGFLLRTVSQGSVRWTVVAANSDLGALYGTFHLLRLMQMGQPIDSLNLTEQPSLQLRLMNHWDNLNGSIERGYGGRSNWQWAELPGKISPRYTEYARACAAIGLNGAVVNNVNADVRILSADYLPKVAALADVWRPYGVKVYLCANFSAPVTLGHLETADPLEAKVADWWKAKADEIYQAVPDFGGFLVKANSEGQPGPKTYHRTHADGANLLADALAPHKGNVVWRAFVYDEDVDPDRAKRAYMEFMQLDGQFRPNVAIQVKNGPIDFQPREPFHPLFGAMKQTSVIAEIEATQEYLGQAKHLVYLGTMWEEFLQSDTFAKGAGSTVAKALAGKVQPARLTGMVAVTNPGSDANWCGHHFSQANWYAFGRLAWNPELSAEKIADEWVRLTFGNDEKTTATIRGMMMGSRETFVNYTMPLGLHHLIGGNHYAPMPWNAQASRRDWTAVYYHQASAEAIGFNRTRQGDHAVDQYFPEVCDTFDDLAKCPEKFLLWFHRCPWDYQTKSGKTLWDALCAKYYEGAEQAAELQKTWQSLEGKVDARRHKEVSERMATQVADAAQWRDQILKYFAGVNKKEITRPG